MQTKSFLTQLSLTTNQRNGHERGPKTGLRLDHLAETKWKNLTGTTRRQQERVLTSVLWGVQGFQTRLNALESVLGQQVGVSILASAEPAQVLFWGKKKVCAGLSASGGDLHGARPRRDAGLECGLVVAWTKSILWRKTVHMSLWGLGSLQTKRVGRTRADHSNAVWSKRAPETPDPLNVFQACLRCLNLNGCLVIAETGLRHA